MSTHKELTAGTLIRYLECFPKDTKVVVGNKDNPEVSTDCHANTYYPSDKPFTTWIVIDHGEN